MVFDLWEKQSDASQYLKNCEKVKVGMSLKEAKQIMGDFNYQERKNRSEIWTYFNNDTAKTYHLSYPTVLAASTGTEIYFDPKNQLVTNVICGE
jgi:hypothetical protein